MFNLTIYTYGLLAISFFAILGWMVSLARQNVTHVDSMWSLFFSLSAAVYALFTEYHSARSMIILILVSIWSIRLCVFLTWRNWGPHEDSRYSVIRNNNQPHFWLKSLYIVFGLQAILAWIISISLLGGINSDSPINILDYIGIALFVIGFMWEIMADWQLSRFKANPNNKQKVLNTGLWRYSRHPNYFGECCVWWGLYLIALAAGAWWAIISPLLMTLLLLKVSGVSLLESTIVDRRPDYADYIRKTNAFLPGKPKT